MSVGRSNLSGLVSVLGHRIPALTYWGTLTIISTIHVSDAVLPPWHVAYSAPKTEVLSITHDAVLKMLRNGRNVAGKDFILVDLRRADHEVCIVISSSRYMLRRYPTSWSANREGLFAGLSTCPPRAYGPLFQPSIRCSRRPVCGRLSSTTVGLRLLHEEHSGKKVR